MDVRIKRALCAFGRFHGQQELIVDFQGCAFTGEWAELARTIRLAIDAPWCSENRKPILRFRDVGKLTGELIAMTARFTSDGHQVAVEFEGNEVVDGSYDEQLLPLLSYFVVKILWVRPGCGFTLQSIANDVIYTIGNDVNPSTGLPPNAPTPFPRADVWLTCEDDQLHISNMFASSLKFGYRCDTLAGAWRDSPEF